MELPPFPEITPGVLQAIADRHGLGTRASTRLPQVGIFNAIYLLGDDVVLRIPRNHPAFVKATRNEAIAVPVARSAGVRTPAILAFDDAHDLLPVPYTVYERVHGETLGRLDLDPDETPAAWREVGRDLARLHAGVSRAGPAGRLDEPESLPDPRELPAELAEAGHFGPVEARWLEQWLDRLEPAVAAPGQQVLVHGDIQSTNIIVQPRSLAYSALLDWGSCGWADAAFDFAGIPLRAVPFLLDGYREVARREDTPAEARILWRHLQLALVLLQRPPQPGLSWAERPAGMLLEILRFFADEPGGSWRDLRP
ncbi:MAG: hypothetical protein AVDCRST_MAG26-3896 [uncultured Chloroflexia bacterium]|uniref:Aminoglycoside phosphotransferase domain-containing protein n=1 Tax=uncultured Chloroflexia bacterium TaxID=1672391 RepID=A0A6J4JUY3_9CHLR|nr:MAG: hypothetical protein AVDCRST_MAG26-3896 [uncultured Chloroflexia bacterium]